MARAIPTYAAWNTAKPLQKNTRFQHAWFRWVSPRYHPPELAPGGSAYGGVFFLGRFGCTRKEIASATINSAFYPDTK